MFPVPSIRPAARKITATLAAAALALGAITATAMPARANSEDVARVLAGIAALAIIGHAIKSGQGHAAPVHGYPQHPYPAGPGWNHGKPGGHPAPQYRPPPPPPVRGLPGVCAIRISGVHDDFYTRGCLRDRGFRVELPNQCARQMRAPRGLRTVYSGHCLRATGFDRVVRPHVTVPYPYSR
jgi:hypothetical protein